MQFLTLLKHPILLFIIGMCCILLAVFLKQFNVSDFYNTPLFITGLIVEGLAIFLYIKNKLA